MENSTQKNPPVSEKLKTIPNLLGIRLNEQPKYEVLKKEGSVEIRRYEPFMLAQIIVRNESVREQAVNKGFVRLANYIFGENTTDLYDEERHSEKMAMTAPVYHEFRDGAWVVSFVIPAKYDLVSVPRPLDSNILITPKPMKTVAALTYSGNNDEEHMQKALVELQEWINRDDIKMTSDFYFAQYDPPFTIPFLKRNEVLVKIADFSH